MVDRVGLLGGPTVDVTPLGAKVVDDPSLRDADEPPGQCPTGRIELISASPGTDEHVLCHFPRSVLVERLSADPVDQRTMCLVGLFEIGLTGSECLVQAVRLSGSMDGRA